MQHELDDFAGRFSDFAQFVGTNEPLHQLSVLLMKHWPAGSKSFKTITLALIRKCLKTPALLFQFNLCQDQTCVLFSQKQAAIAILCHLVTFLLKSLFHSGTL